MTNEQLTQREKIPGTPFTLIYQDNIGWFVVMGDHRLTEPTLSKEEQIEKLETNKWELITTVVISVVERLKQYEQINLQKEKQKPFEDGYPTGANSIPQL